ncbi:hypothetical protein BVX97_06540 [bacterium E08(2017)]|nr:hypothetical protein BVX97_06540 [bacterium E08(2017)]
MVGFIIEIIMGFWGTLNEMAPYLLLGFFVAGVLSVFISSETVEKHLGGKGIWPVIKASFLGVPLPLCSCGVIPVAASLRKHGASKGAATSFLISTPQTGVDSIFATFSLLGPVFAIFRPVAAFIAGVLGGSIVEMASDEEPEPGEDLERHHGKCCCGGHGGSKMSRALNYGFVTLAREIAWPLLIGLVIAGLINTFVPQQFFTETIGTGILPMIMMLVLGIPLYVCATASIPIAAAMMLKGISPGAALVFLMTGPATNAAAIATIWKVLGRKTAGLYLAIVAGTALAAGFCLDLVFKTGGFVPGTMEMTMMPGWLSAIFAVLLLVVLANSLLRSAKKDIC